MSNPIQRLFDALAQMAGTEFPSGEFLPSGRKARLLFGESTSSKEERSSTNAVTQEQPHATHLSAAPCQGGPRSWRTRQAGDAR